MVTIENIAIMCHEQNRMYCKMMGDNTQLPWDEAPDWQKQSAISGVKFHLKNPNAGPEASHENWAADKIVSGWKYGPVKDPDKKEHPCLVKFHELPKDQQAKDKLFFGIVDALRDLMDE